MKLAGALLVVTGCGRIAFDPTSDAATVTDATPANACGPLAGQVACLRFDGDTLDSSGAGNHGSGAVAFIAAPRGQAGLFDDTVDLRIADSATMDFMAAMTVATWARLDVVPDVVRDVLVDRNSGYAFGITDTGVLQFTTLSGVMLNGGVPVPLATWIHIAVTYDGARAQLFVAGAQSAAVSFPAIIPAASPDGTRVGGPIGGGATTESFQGALDELAIWDRALTDQEICRLAGTC